MPKARKSAFSPEYGDIIERLIARRLRLGMTQTELGEAYGENQSFISRVERKQRRIDVYEFVRLCRILRIRPGTILQPLYEQEACS